MRAIGIGNVISNTNIERLEILANLRIVLNVAIKQNISNIFIYGNIMYSENTILCVHVIKILKKYDLNYYIVAGAYDEDQVAKYNLYDAPNITYINEPKIIVIDDVPVKFLPYGCIFKPNNSMLNVASCIPTTYSLNNKTIVAGNVNEEKQINNFYYLGNITGRFDFVEKRSYHYINCTENSIKIIPKKFVQLITRKDILLSELNNLKILPNYKYRIIVDCVLEISNTYRNQEQIKNVYCRSNKPSLQKHAEKLKLDINCLKNRNRNRNRTTKINTSLNLDIKPIIKLNSVEDIKPIVKLNKVEDIKTELHLIENFVNECKFNNLTGTKVYNYLVEYVEELRFKNYLIINNLTHVS